MLKAVQEDYAKLTPKGRLILVALVQAFDASGDEGLTRAQIAERLGQWRLYPHDDKAIRQLEETGFIHIVYARLGDREDLFFGCPEGRQRRSINFHTIYHIHVFNSVWYDFVVPMLRNDGLLDDREPGYVGDVLEAVKSAGNWLKGLIS